MLASDAAHKGVSGLGGAVIIAFVIMLMSSGGKKK